MYPECRTTKNRYFNYGIHFIQILNTYLTAVNFNCRHIPPAYMYNLGLIQESFIIHSMLQIRNGLYYTTEEKATEGFISSKYLSSVLSSVTQSKFCGKKKKALNLFNFYEQDIAKKCCKKSFRHF